MARVVDQNPGFVWPQSIYGIPPGVPTELAARVLGRLNFENFIGDQVSTRSAELYVRSNTGGAVITSGPVIPAAGDTVSRGLWGLTLTPDPVGPKGLTLRQELDVLAIDGFDADRPTLWAIRFRVNSAAPTAPTYSLSAGGLLDEFGTTGTVSDGPHVHFVPGTGWVVRASRAGANVDSAVLAVHDNAFHVAGFLHTGTDLIPFWDDVVGVGLGNVPELQPSVPITSYVPRMVATLGSVVVADVDTDWILWGS